MRMLYSILGNLLLAAGLGGLALVAWGPPAATNDAAAPRLIGTAWAIAGPPLPNGPSRPAGDLEPAGRLAAPAGDLAASAAGPEAVASSPISRVEIPRLSLEADVVPAPLVERGGETTWEVPAFKAGHAEHSAGAGEPGTTVLLGHVASRAAGAVFKHLDRAQAGDVIHVFSGARRFDYHVVDARAVPPTDLAALGPTGAASLALVTCTGRWLPTIWDYTEHLVVRAELAASTSPE